MKAPQTEGGVTEMEATEASQPVYQEIHGRHLMRPPATEVTSPQNAQITGSLEGVRRAAVTTQLSRLEQILEYLKVLYR
jgi:hypothetical protein